MTDWPLKYADKDVHREVLLAMTEGDTRVGILCSARRGGKTALARTLVASAAEKRQTRAWYVAPTYQMARELFFEPFLTEYPRRLIRKVNRTELRIDFRSGARLWCKSTERPDSLLGRGLTLVCADEYQLMPANVYDAHLGPLVAETPDKAQGRVLLTGTPRGVGHPFHAMWLKGQDGLTPGWRSWLLTAYEANMVPREQIDALRAEAEARGKTALKIWRREWMADWQAFVGQVFEDWAPETMVVEPPEGMEFEAVIGGMDFGFAESHPGAVTVWGRRNEKWWCIAEVYEAGKTIETFWIPRLQALGKAHGLGTVYCDPARPDHIQTLRNAGIRAHPGENEVWGGIVTVAGLMESGRLRVSPKCPNLIGEIPGYRWEETRDGALRERPAKVRDHAIDSMRYALHSALGRPVISSLGTLGARR